MLPASSRPSSLERDDATRLRISQYVEHSILKNRIGVAMVGPFLRKSLEF
jgi:hypothetical protein